MNKTVPFPARLGLRINSGAVCCAHGFELYLRALQDHAQSEGQAQQKQQEQAVFLSDRLLSGRQN